MNDGIKLLMERVKTHPEEFVFDERDPFKESRWRKLIDHYKEYLEPEDVNQLKGEINKLVQDKFTEAIMEELLDPKVEEQLSLNPYSTKTVPLNATHTAGQTQGVSLNSASLKDHMLAHMGWLDKEEKTKKQGKEHKTLFGKLFNYT